jgi:hypothetical protein
VLVDEFYDRLWLTGLSMRACWHFTVVLLLGMLAVGCAVLGGGCARNRACCQPSCPPATVALDCQPVERKPLVVDLSRLKDRPQPPASHPYCNLTERDAQCLAAMNAPNAQLLEQEADAVAAQATGHHQADDNQATQESLRLQAVHERNRNASAAVQLLLKISEAENGADSIRRQINEAKDTLADLRRLQIAGLDLPLSVPQTEGQHLEGEHKLAELELTLDLLNEQLSMLLGGELPAGARHWPDVNLQVDPALPPLDEAQGIALAQRADLAALRVAESGGSTGAMRAVLGLSGAGLGGSSGMCGLCSLLHFRAAADEAAARADQLQSAIADKQRTIRHEVAQAIATIDARLNQVAIAQRRVESLRQHLENLRQTSSNVAGASFDLRRARLAVLAAEQDVFHDVIEWKIAIVKLHEAEAQLAIDCGYMAALNYLNCCY